jgi:hypothetical protein
MASGDFVGWQLADLAIRQNRAGTVFDRTAVCYADSSISCATLRRGSVWDFDKFANANDDGLN